MEALPLDIRRYISHFLPPLSVIRLRSTCTALRSAIPSPLGRTMQQRLAELSYERDQQEILFVASQLGDPALLAMCIARAASAAAGSERTGAAVCPRPGIDASYTALAECLVYSGGSGVFASAVCWASDHLDLLLEVMPGVTVEALLSLMALMEQPCPECLVCLLCSLLSSSSSSGLLHAHSACSFAVRENALPFLRCAGPLLDWPLQMQLRDEAESGGFSFSLEWLDTILGFPLH